MTFCNASNLVVNDAKLSNINECIFFGCILSKKWKYLGEGSNSVTIFTDDGGFDFKLLKNIPVIEDTSNLSL